MSSTAIQLSSSATMGIYEPSQQTSMWRDAGASSIVHSDAKLENKFEYTYQQLVEASRDEPEVSRNTRKAERRLAQNREAAKKSRLRKKAYVQQLENSRLKLVQLERELHRAKQGLYMGGTPYALGIAANINTGILAFELEYGPWVVEQQRQNSELRNALQANVSDDELGILVHGCLTHYLSLLRMKADAAKADVFYLMFGTWRTSVERFFLWMGGFRPSQLLTVLRPHLGPLTDQQIMETNKLQRSSQQAEEALSKGLDKLEQTLAEIVFVGGLGGDTFASQIAALDKLEAIEGFVNQADHLREQTLQLMSGILTPRQAANGLLALGEYFDRLRVLSSLWEARPRDPG